jgi:hypothetical protein
MTGIEVIIVTPIMAEAGSMGAGKGVNIRPDKIGGLAMSI